MKTLLLTLIALAPLASFAAPKSDIELSPMAINGSSSGPSAAKLIQTLEAEGVKGIQSGNYINYDVKNGKVTITNGAACENGRSTFRVEFDQVDKESKVIQHVEIEDSDTCKPGSHAESFYGLLQKFGADKLGGDCGLGHCWVNLNSISCFVSPDKNGKVYKTCSVITSNSGVEIPN